MSTRRIIDITAPITADLPNWESDEGLGPEHRQLMMAISKGDIANVSALNEYGCHTGTHGEYALLGLIAASRSHLSIYHSH